MPSPSFTFLLASTRTNGNAEQLAKIAAQSLPVNAEQRWLRLIDLPLPPFTDRRHPEPNYQYPKGNELTLAQATLDCTDLVFVTPVYWYSMPSPLKLYVDYWSAWMRVAELDFKARMKDKTLWAIMSTSGPPEKSEPVLNSYKLCAQFLSMRWGGHVLGNGTKQGDVLNDHAALERAKHLFSSA